MTIFGKIVLGGLLFGIVGVIFYGVTSSVKNEIPRQDIAATTTQEVITASTTASVALSAETSTTSVKLSGKKMAFSEFMKQGGAYKCTVTQTVATMTTNGTVYLYGAKVKANFAVSVAGQSIDTSMILRDGYSYTWTSNSPTKGFKTKIVNNAENNQTSPKGTYTWDGSQIGEYDCSPWIAENSMFEIPSTITFTTQ